MLTSLCTKYHHFLAQGILGGLTNGLTYIPALTAINQYFRTDRPLALGIASSGSSLAGVIVPIMLNRLLNRTNIGFPGFVRLLGFTMLLLAIVACATITSNAPKRRSGAPLLLSAWRNPAYATQVLGYAKRMGLSTDLASHLISILNAASLFGRLTSGVVANRIGRFNILSTASATCGVLNLCWIPIRGEAAMIVFSVLLGFFSRIVIGVFLATLAMTVPRVNEIGSYMGMALEGVSFAGLRGTPITGAMISAYR
ncbi:hypothetical protein BBP40_000473, partial [Aspergillus hancockii]